MHSASVVHGVEQVQLSSGPPTGQHSQDSPGAEHVPEVMPPHIAAVPPSGAPARQRPVLGLTTKPVLQLHVPLRVHEPASADIVGSSLHS